MTWLDHAACKGQTQLFFSHRPSQRAKAHKLCETCPVTGACAQEAFDLARLGELHGIWGGTTQAYRESLVGKHRRAWWNNDQ